MISKIVLTINVFLILLIASVIARAIIRKQQIIGKPPVPVLFFVLAKMLVAVNLTF